MADYPANYPSFTDLDGQATLAANNHAARHNKVHAEVLALSQRVGKNGDTNTSSHEYKLGDVSGIYKAETQGNKNTNTSLSPVNDTVYPTNKAVKTYIDAQISALNSTLTAAIATAKAQAKQESYPVGSLYYNANDSTNPGTLLGFGTWVAYAQGRVPVGIAPSGTFNVAGATGGEEKHTLVDSEIPTYSGQFASMVPSGHGGFRNGIAGAGGQMGNASYPAAAGTHTENTWSWTIGFGGGQSHNVLQPYIVVYIWQRTA